MFKCHSVTCKACRKHSSIVTIEAVLAWACTSWNRSMEQNQTRPFFVFFFSSCLLTQRARPSVWSFAVSSGSWMSCYRATLIRAVHGLNPCSCWSFCEWPALSICLTANASSSPTWALWQCQATVRWHLHMHLREVNMSCCQRGYLAQVVHR